MTDLLLAVRDDLAGDLAGRPDLLEGADDLADVERLEAERTVVPGAGRRVDPLPRLVDQHRLQRHGQRRRAARPLPLLVPGAAQLAGRLAGPGRRAQRVGAGGPQ